MPDTTLTSAEQVIAGVQAAYDRVKLWPEDRMRPSAVEELGPGFTDLLLLRNLVPDLLSLARAGLEAGKAEESMRERAGPSMWATVAESDYDGELRWDCHTEGDQGDGDSLPTITLAADTFPVGTTLEIVEPPEDAIRALPLTGGDKP